ncbi:MULTISPECIES: response regulator transcription factor [Brevundimonas]|jgi:DNA-binding response OmpR family regulator|uniref:response regulator transcription factor n=1 Tax=Brevundimonas TaxID=41275 RepID=UPI000E0C97D9|nr:MULTISPECIES: response regulator transcription factor [Brevundimonas]MBD3832356.1 response regulator transcription factor [Brevundimonas sp.]NWE54141.1 response regulator transcription factor [Brevundimonas sp. P7753]WQE37518.1 response regulator transcription factor [Brevundimonas bullata]
MKIAVLDDDPVQLETISSVAQAAGYRPVLFSRAQALISALRKDTFDLLIVDWNLPDRSGLEVLAWARTNLKPPPPMLLVTSRAEDEDIVAGLNAGADDYLPKPLSPAVLEARINALMRRAYAQPSTPGAEIHGDTVFHDSSSAVTRNGKTVVLTAKEYALAQLLFRNLHRALSRTYILETVWGNEPNLNSRSLDMHISRIRTKLELRPEQGFRLTPIYSYGYRLERVSAVEALMGDIASEDA